MPFNIIVRNYQHYNQALGKYINSRKQYEKEMVKGEYIPFEKAEQIGEQTRKKNIKPYNGLSPKAMKFIHQVKDSARKDGTIEVTNRYVEGLKDVGVKVDYPIDKLPKHYKIDQGGFE